MNCSNNSSTIWVAHERAGLRIASTNSGERTAIYVRTNAEGLLVLSSLMKSGELLDCLSSLTFLTPAIRTTLRHHPSTHTFLRTFTPKTHFSLRNCITTKRPQRDRYPYAIYSIWNRATTLLCLYWLMMTRWCSSSWTLITSTCSKQVSCTSITQSLSK